MDSIPLHDAFLRAIWHLPEARIRAGKLITRWHVGSQVTTEEAEAILTEFREMDTALSEWFNEFIASQRQSSTELMRFFPSPLDTEKFKTCAGEWINWRSNGAEAFLKFRCNYLILRYIRSRLYDAFHPIVNPVVHTFANHHLPQSTLVDLVDSIIKLIPTFWNYDPDDKVAKLFEDYSSPRERSKVTMAIFSLNVLSSMPEITEEQRAWVMNRITFLLDLIRNYEGVVFSLRLPDWKMIPHIEAYGSVQRRTKTFTETADRSGAEAR